MDLKSPEASFYTMNEMFSYTSWTKDASDILNDLLLVIQGIVSGTVTVSHKVLNELCMEWKFQLSTKSPVVILRYRLDSDSKCRLIQDNSVLRCQALDGKNGKLKENSRREMVFEHIKEDSHVANTAQQDVPGCSVRNGSEETKHTETEQLVSLDDSRRNQTRVDSIETNVSNMLNSNCKKSTSESESSDSIKVELVVVPPDSDMTSYDTKNKHKNCEAIKLNEHSKRNVNVSKELKTYSRTHSEFKKQPYDYARESLQTKQNKRLLEGMRTGEQLFSCKDCGKCFTSSDDFLKHRRIHTGELPFKCEDCGKSFIQSSQLATHQRMHRGEQTSFIQSDYLLQHRKVFKSQRPHSCEYCGKSFVQKFALVDHQRRHTGERPYSCKICGRSFMQAGHLTQHQRIHSGEKSFSMQRLWQTY